MNISKLNSRYKLLYQRDLQVDLSLTLENQSNQAKPVKRPTPSPEKMPEENNLDDNSKVSRKYFWFGVVECFNLQCSRLGLRFN